MHTGICFHTRSQPLLSCADLLMWRQPELSCCITFLYTVIVVKHNLMKNLVEKGKRKFEEKLEACHRVHMHRSPKVVM